MGRRLAMLIATYEYEDTAVRQLTAPAHDAEAFAAVLRDPAIAGFEVTTLVNQPHHLVGEAIGDFYRDRRRDDLTLLYFTGHGLKDDSGRLYLAMANTRHDGLLFTALSAEQIDQAMEGCISRQKVLILDCCYSGAFPAGRISKADTAVHALERFHGRGRIVLTGSDATQYSFEGNQAHGQAVQSVFTRYLVEGLRDGSADLDGDGDITLDELYGYVHDRVVDEMPQQRPKKQDNVEGRIVIARNINWSLPAHLRHAVSSPIATDRLGALDGLAHLHRIGNAAVRAVALEEIRRLADDDSKLVSAAAAGRLQSLQPSSPQSPPEQHRPYEQEPSPVESVPEERTSEPPTPAPGPPPRVSRTAQHTEVSRISSRSSTAPPIASSPGVPAPITPWTARFMPRTRRGRAVTGGAAVLLAAAVAVIVFQFVPGLSSGSGGSGSSSSTGIDLDRPSAVLNVRSSAIGSVMAVTFSPDGKTLAAVSNGDRTVQLWDAATHRSLTPLTTTSSGVLSVAFSRDGKTLAAGTTNGLGKGGAAQAWRVPAGTSIATMTGHTDGVNSVALSPDGKILATGGWDGTARLWDAATGKRLTTLISVQGDVPCVCSVAFSPDGKMLATGSSDNTVRLWDVAARKLRHTLTGHTRGVLSVAFTPDGRTLASGSYDGSIRLWNVATGKHLATLQQDTLSGGSNVTGLAFDPKDGNILASVGENGENRVLLWNVTTHEIITALTASERGLSSVAWSPDGRTLATGDNDKAKVRLWDIAHYTATASASSAASGISSPR